MRAHGFIIERQIGEYHISIHITTKRHVDRWQLRYKNRNEPNANNNNFLPIH